jgi:hypothetical protein
VDSSSTSITCAVEPSRHADRQTLSREFLDHGEQPQAAAIVRAGLDEIVTSGVIRMFRAQSEKCDIGVLRTMAEWMRRVQNWNYDTVVEPARTFLVGVGKTNLSQELGR